MEECLKVRVWRGEPTARDAVAASVREGRFIRVEMTP